MRESGGAGHRVVLHQGHQRLDYVGDQRSIIGLCLHTHSCYCSHLQPPHISSIHACSSILSINDISNIYLNKIFLGVVALQGWVDHFHHFFSIGQTRERLIDIYTMFKLRIMISFVRCENIILNPEVSFFTIVSFVHKTTSVTVVMMSFYSNKERERGKEKTVYLFQTNDVVLSIN